MPDSQTTISFNSINSGYQRTFKQGKLTLGMVAPLSHYPDSPVYEQQPALSMQKQLERIQLAETLGFAAVWLRDVPFNVPSFGDAGQIFDPFVYLGALAMNTQSIALGVSSIILPLRHPAHVAKAAASADALSGGRLILGVASGDRPAEYPALNQSFPDRGYRFRESVEYIRETWKDFPSFDNHHGQSQGQIDMLPKPYTGKLPLLITGGSQQAPEWIAQQGDGWMLYPRNLGEQAITISEYQQRLKTAQRAPQPVMQPLYVDLLENDDAPPQNIHLGFRCGINFLQRHLMALEDIGVNHVALNLRFNQADINDTLKRLSDRLIPQFS